MNVTAVTVNNTNPVMEPIQRLVLELKIRAHRLKDFDRPWLSTTSATFL